MDVPEMWIDLDHLNSESGWLGLDFANTVEDHGSENQVEMLNSYADLVSWAEQACILTGDQARHLLEQADRRPAEAARVLEKARSRRDMLYRILLAVAHQEHPDDSDLAELNRALAEVTVSRRLIQTSGGYDWAWMSDDRALDPMIGPVIYSAADLLTTGDLDRVKECADEMGCGWLFYDVSKNRSRRWCGMSGCGNRAKARRYYHRTRGAQGENDEAD